MAPSHVRRVLVPVAAAAALAWTPAAGAWSGSGSGSSTTTASSYSGEACLAKSTITGPPVARRFVRRLAASLQSSVTVTASAGCATLPSSGGMEQATVGATASVGDFVTVNSEGLGGTVAGQGNASDSTATVASADLAINSILGVVTVHGDLLFAHAHAECTSSGAMVSGDSEVTNLVVNGVTVGGGTAPNQTITVPGPLPGETVTVILNAQEPSGSGNSQAIDVTAVKVLLPDGEVDLVTAHADIQCVSGTPSPCPAGKDFITGGGWFDDHANPSHRDYFAHSAGYKNDSRWGHLVYMDKAAGIKVDGDPVWYGSSATTAPTMHDGLASTTPDALATRLFGSTSAANVRYVIGTLRNGGAYLVRTVDVAEPGRHADQFDIAFLTADTNVLNQPTGSYTYNGGYTAGSDPNGIAGGNVQLHPNCGCGGT
jgi:hypothetical protein